mmetsp:Transcript_1716/g.2718  ORF Transcript_1716/g.2718 Transcript_1716/m.2718 type:complete len:256 (+) Transcript_1716:270-1037(+)
MPSAPSHGERSGSRYFFMSPYASSTAGVAVQPGWHVTNATEGCVSLQRSHSSTCPRLAYAYAMLPLYAPAEVPEAAAKSNLVLYMPPLETTTTRAPAVASSAPMASSVSRYVPKSRWHAKVVSTPSRVIVFELSSTPALHTRTSSAGGPPPPVAAALADAKSDHTRRTSASSEQSHTSRWTSELPERSTMPRRASSPRPSLRHTMYSVAPFAARKEATSKPTPLFAPVTMHTLPPRSTVSSMSGPALSCCLRWRS